MAGAVRRRDGRIAQERMLEEAMAAIAEDGLAALTMSALAERLGTSGGHILYYFGSKDRLLLEALRWSEAQLTGERAELMARRVTAQRKLTLFVELYLPLGPRDPRWTLWIELWARTASNEPLKAAQEEIDEGWQRDLEALLAKGVEQGRFAPLDVPARASELLALLDGLSTRVVLGQRGADRAAALERARSATALLVPTPLRVPPA
ncbi:MULTISPECIES: TetR/AcrR family transcriptional regulator [unclassified Streptomyces]|uniref:TetR/AcrR family transcriptional regulator n=1 Tax=unclassified Streptomyces TaxID=2593676 RepID=UPI0024819F1A|nr:MULTISPECIES: TetR/AcrR family transcriptional regulator [unclassified Streptomyces]MDA5286320.1 TetR/AcrR family transcriptional regulator [Streptomyces sp. Isolate_45]MDX2392438.1 TetR family transcriptional regulator [Streptomyces sp. DK15]